ncbi:MAG: L-threonylcarbamoyladenylate synthase [Cyclobacteriaceae bacterium]|jgi:L-threonylcarbamoyladenylate synthase
MAQIGTDITLAKHFLENGSLVGIPTETVYGLAANALDEKAALDIFKVKNRPSFDPLILHTYALPEISKYVDHIPEKAYRLAQAFWPGPLTILLKKNKLVPDIVTSGLETVAVRIPNHELTLALLRSLDFPLAAPSANPFGYVSPTTAKHVNDQLGTLIPYILDGGSSQIGMESTIIGFDENDEATIFRLGGTKVEEIEALIGHVNILLNRSSNPIAPGMLKSHYAPGKDVFIGNISELITKHENKNIGVISFQKDYSALNIKKQIILSENGDLDEAAREVFSALREMDVSEVDLIVTEKLPDIGLGRAINDRLERASVRY